ncbi:MAG: flagellar biosynthesis anti-sigma factor FlgM [Blastocatellia bacterium]|nr:flagellar biosynthesis anti-sigma factor FlgM [Blastocatellia bacterium]
MSQIKLNGGNDLDPRITTGRIEAERAADADAPAPGAAPSRAADSIRVSERAATIGELAARVRQLPDVRRERVEHFRAQLEAGAYRPSAEDVADALLRDGETHNEAI